jgi:hypothetical protein
MFLGFVVFSPSDLLEENVYLVGTFTDILLAQQCASEAAAKARATDDRAGEFIAHVILSKVNIPMWEGVP